MRKEGAKQHNSYINQYSIDPSPGGGGVGVGWGGGWGWKVQNRTILVQTNILLIHLLAGVGVGGWIGMEGTKQNNPCTNQHSVDPSPGHYRVQTTNNDVEILGLTKNVHVIIHTLK